MNRDELLDKLEAAIENRECFWLMRDGNMVKAWEEQCDILLEKLYGLDNEKR
jgi:hypothetical protein